MLSSYFLLISSITNKISSLNSFSVHIYWRKLLNIPKLKNDLMFFFHLNIILRFISNLNKNNLIYIIKYYKKVSGVLLV